MFDSRELALRLANEDPSPKKCPDSMAPTEACDGCTDFPNCSVERQRPPKKEPGVTDRCPACTEYPAPKEKQEAAASDLMALRLQLQSALSQPGAC